MKIVPLTQGKVAIVSDRDWPRVRRYKWYAMRTRGLWYATRNVRMHGRPRQVLMHRFILTPPRNREIDHRNCDGLDNRRSNLRLATSAQNKSNRKRQRNNTSGVKGVSPNKLLGGWRASIQHQRKQFNLGTFVQLREAARAYQQAAIRLFGDYHRVA